MWRFLGIQVFIRAMLTDVLRLMEFVAFLPIERDQIFGFLGRTTLVANAPRYKNNALS